eukprot:CAMPEP_0175131528 /NCGR_PEP_ID=MMETSP0087-20121206/6591_1 /TAXON_ID=136419 /ORGANISM="Unknown Unknown, Strain D1" /LENGTH=776 /DNA_ID=CAMNT_0016413825 /DNA_START=32 /DNA_END=2362 /DNA_ORIENTATION=-
MSIKTQKEGKAIDTDTNSFINGLVADSRQEIYFRGWTKVQDSNSVQRDEFKERIVVVASFRLFTIKADGRFGPKVNPLSLRLLRSVTVTEEEPTKVHLKFEVEGHDMRKICIDTENMSDLVTCILFAAESITFGRLQVDGGAAIVKSVPDHMLAGYLPPEPDSEDGLLAAYLAECDIAEIPQRVPVLDAMMTNFQLDVRILDLRECLSSLPEPYDKDCRAIVNCIKYSDWYHHVVAEDIAIKDGGLAALAGLFGRKTCVTKLSLENNKIRAVRPLANSLKLGLHGLTELSIAKNSIGDQGLAELCDGLKKGGSLLSVLSLQACGFTGKGFQELAVMLSKPEWRSSLRVLEVSDNKAGKVGSRAIEAWIENSKNISMALECLNCANCELDVDLFIAGLAKRPESKPQLASVNLSFNKFSKTTAGEVAALIQAGGAITSLMMQGVGLSRAGFTGILEAVVFAKHSSMYHLDFSANDLGVKGAKDCLASFQKNKTEVQQARSGFCCLVLDDNNLSVEGVMVMCQALSGTKINALKLARNAKLGMFTNTKNLGVALAGLVTDTPALTELDVQGDNIYHLKSALDPLLVALASNTSLRKLNLIRNRMPEKTALLLAEAVAKNHSLTSLACQRNYLTMPAFRAIADAVCGNPNITDFEIPMKDIKALYNDENQHTLRDTVNKLESTLIANAKASARRASVSSAAEADYKTTDYKTSQRNARRKASTLQLNTASRTLAKLASDSPANSKALKALASSLEEEEKSAIAEVVEEEEDEGEEELDG